MRPAIAAALLLTLASCGGEPPAEELATTESALISADSCGVQTNPYNPQCTKTNRTTWKCQTYVLHPSPHCYQAHGTTPIPGTYWAYRGTHPDFEVDGNIAWYPGRGNTVDVGDDGNDNVMVFTKGTVVANQGPLLTTGWSYATTDLSPSTFPNNMVGMGAIEFLVYGGDYGISICAYTQPNYQGQIGADCFRAGPDDVTFFDMGVYGYPTIRSFQVF